MSFISVLEISHSYCMPIVQILSFPQTTPTMLGVLADGNSETDRGQDICIAWTEERIIY